MHRSLKKPGQQDAAAGSLTLRHEQEVGMQRDLRVLAAAGVLVAALTLPDASFAQKSGGTLKIGHFDSPASMSMLEESTVAVNRPTMGVFNNLVMFRRTATTRSPFT